MSIVEEQQEEVKQLTILVKKPKRGRRASSMAKRGRKSKEEIKRNSIKILTELARGKKDPSAIKLLNYYFYLSNIKKSIEGQIVDFISKRKDN